MATTALPAGRFEKGQSVYAKYKGKTWVGGTVLAVNNDGTYDITYSNGKIEQAVRAKYVDTPPGEVDFNIESRRSNEPTDGDYKKQAHFNQTLQPKTKRKVGKGKDKKMRRRSASRTRKVDALLLLKVVDATDLQLSSGNEGTPNFELIASLGDTFFKSDQWKNSLDPERHTCPDFDKLNGPNSFAFKYVVGNDAKSQTLRLIIGQRLANKKLDVLGQCVMKFPKKPLLNRSIQLTHPIGPCERSKLITQIEGCTNDNLVEKLTAEAGSKKLGSVKYKCIILERPFLASLLTDYDCLESMSGKASNHLFIMIECKLKILQPKDGKEGTTYHPYLKATFISKSEDTSTGMARICHSMIPKNAPAVKFKEGTDWNASHEAVFTFYSPADRVETASVSIEVCDYVGQGTDPSLGSLTLTSLEEIRQNYKAEERSGFLTNREGEVGKSELAVDMTLFDPKELSRRCDMKVEQYQQDRKKWKRVKKGGTPEEQKAKQIRRDRKKKERARLLRRIMAKNKRSTMASVANEAMAEERRKHEASSCSDELAAKRRGEQLSRGYGSGSDKIVHDSEDDGETRRNAPGRGDKEGGSKKNPTSCWTCW